jgi:hypothetical protein
MSLKRIDVRARSAGSPAAVYALLADGSTWPRWSPLGSFELVSPGNGRPEGLGAIRVFTTGRAVSREEVVELVPGRRLSYAVLGGTLPIRRYRADIDLEPDGGGTRIRWASSFEPSRAGVGWSAPFLRWFIGRCARGLAAAAAESPVRS